MQPSFIHFFSFSPIGTFFYTFIRVCVLCVYLYINSKLNEGGWFWFSNDLEVFLTALKQGYIESRTTEILSPARTV